jgi:hypothetical protein
VNPRTVSFSFKGLLIALWLILVAGAYYVVHKPFDLAAGLRLASTAWHFASAGLLVLTAGGIGRWLCPAIHTRPAARMAMQGAIGLGILGLFQLLVGSFFGVSGTLAWITLVILLAVLQRPVVSWMRDLADLTVLVRAGGRFGCLIACLIAVGLVFSFFFAALPPLKFDALVDHLALPRVYLNTGRVYFVENNALSGMPHIGEMLYVWALALTGAEESAAILGWLIGVLGVVGVLGHVAERFNPRAGWAAAGALLSGASLLQSLAWAYVDWFTLIFGFGLLVSLDLNPKRPWLAGFFAGFALGSKYTAGCALIAGFAVLILGQNPYASVPKYFQRFRRAALFAFSAGLVFLPWAVRNFAATGNPTYPFFFPAGAMTAERQALYSDQPPWGGTENALLLPLQATMTGLEGAPGFGASIGFLLLGLGILAGLGWRERTEAQQRALRQVTVFGLTGLIVWAVAGRFSGLLLQSRLYYSLFPAFAILAASGYDGLARFHWPGVRLGRIAGILIMGALALNVFEVGRGSVAAGAPNVLLGLMSEEEYRTQNLGMYELAMQAVRKLPAEARVLVLFEPRNLYCLPRCDPDEFLDRWTTDAAAGRHAPAEILANWKMAGYTHLLFYRTGAEFFREDPRYRLDDWRALNAVIITLEPIIDLGGVYALFALP